MYTNKQKKNIEMKNIPTFSEFINENLSINENRTKNLQNEIVRLTFLNVRDYNKSVGILYKNGFKTPTSSYKGNGYYITDDNWKTIEFNFNLKDDILHLLGNIKYEIDFKKPLEYKIFKQGGYLD